MIKGQPHHARRRSCACSWSDSEHERQHGRDIPDDDVIGLGCEDMHT